jgi:metal-responsive CopG/Arc/MetJ family transcriptional regulator
MRTTIELKPELRSRLIAIAAKRGEKGFSSVLNEAVESYLGEEAAREKRRQKALHLRGVLKHEEAAELQKSTAALRASWR